MRYIIMFLPIVALLMQQCQAYNIDTTRPTVISDQHHPSSMFGYSLSAVTLNDTSWLIVGAPRAQSQRENIVRGGAVYRCNLQLAAGGQWKLQDLCQEVILDRYGPTKSSATNTELEKKTDQGLGSTVSAVIARNNSVMIASCAPHYISLAASRKKAVRHDPVGTCFVTSATSSTTSPAFNTRIDEFSPCRNVKKWGHHRQGFCKAGLGMTLGLEGNRLFIGAVGSRYGHGQLFGFPLQQGRSTAPIEYFTTSRLGQLFNQNIYLRPDLYSSSLGPSSDDDIYLGYAVTVGRFSGGGSQQVAVSAPRANRLTGKVVIFDERMNELATVYGDQMGSYFGYSLAAADVNGDGLQDLLVSAPFFSGHGTKRRNDAATNAGLADTGRVTVVYQTRQLVLEKQQNIYGKETMGYFGTALASLSDVDLDGYEDIAVGAPHSGETNTGVVYVYHGSAEGLRSLPTQVIRASDMPGYLVSFGYSLFGGVDTDGNGYPDLIVGAYNSSAAVYFRSRPVVHVQTSLEYTGHHRSVDLESQLLRCTTAYTQAAICLSFTFCMMYSGVGLPRHSEFLVEFRLDARRRGGSRMFFKNLPGVSAQNRTLRLGRKRKWCLPHPTHVYIELERVRDKLTPFVIEASYSLLPLAEHRTAGAPVNAALSRRTRGRLAAVLDEVEFTIVSASLGIRNNCGLDGRCIPDLQLTARPHRPEYVLGSGDRLSLEVTVVNLNEDAYETSFIMNLPQDVDFIGTDKADDSNALPLFCTIHSANNTDTLVCDLGNPMPSATMVHFFVHMMPHIVSDVPSGRFNFSLNASSINSETNSSQHNNVAHLSVPIIVDTAITLFGASVPDVAVLNASKLSVQPGGADWQVGPEVWHVWQVGVQGPSHIIASQLIVTWPSHVMATGENLYYLVEQPIVSGSVVCENIANINPERIKVSKSRAHIDMPSGVVRSRPSGHKVSRRSPGQTFDCGRYRCSSVRCTTGVLTPRDTVTIKLRGRLWSSTLKSELALQPSGLINISSLISARILQLPQAVTASSSQFVTLKVSTLVQGSEVKSPGAPWWLVVVASCGGVSILLVIAFSLYKIGFFERNRRRRK